MNTKNKLTFFICMLVMSSSSTYAKTPLLRTIEKQFPSEPDGSMLSTLNHNNRYLKKKKRPVMHTFYQRSIKTGMGEDDDARLLNAWSDAWSEAGWEPRVISLEDAMTHPEYENINMILSQDHMPFGFYDKLCFMRWLAMAAVGGGWMSDYDTFPLTKNPFAGDGENLPNDGRFTLYDKIQRAGAVPSLASGSKIEYERIMDLLLKNTLQYGLKEKFWTDMYAFIDIATRDRGAYLIQSHVMKGRNAFSFWKRTYTTSRCEGARGDEWAVHFPHTAIKHAALSGFLDELGLPTHVKNRAEIARNFLKQWKVCGYGNKE